jgi:hypothetical protein
MTKTETNKIFKKQTNKRSHTGVGEEGKLFVGNKWKFLCC